jgi:hypothetical protein
MRADGVRFEPDGLKALSAWLSGRIKTGSPRELLARRTMALMLRDADANAGLCRALADAVDPDGKGAVQLFLKRKRGYPRADDSHIAVFLYEERKRLGKHKLAVKEAMTRFGVSHGTVDSAWRKWRPRIERNPKLFGRIKVQ